MDLLFNLIRQFNNLPVAHQGLSSFLNDYQNPNDKIHQLIKQKKLFPLRKGLYVLSEEMTHQIPSMFLMANHLYGPSYVSMDFALQYYGAIPERVYEISSVTFKKSKHYINKYGAFTYKHISEKYYPLGIIHIALAGGLFGLIAKPEKALIDKMVTSPGVIIRSEKDAGNLLLEDWRISSDWLKKIDITLIKTWLNHTPKRESIKFIIKFLKTL